MSSKISIEGSRAWSNPIASHMGDPRDQAGSISTLEVTVVAVKRAVFITLGGEGLRLQVSADFEWLVIGCIETHVSKLK